MARELVIKYWCDNKSAKHPPRTVEGDTILVYSREKGEVVELEICDACLSKITDAEMQILATTFGRQQDPEEIDIDRLCPVMGCKKAGKPFADKAGKNRHMTRVHPDWVDEAA